jgi:hypothetical protein
MKNEKLVQFNLDTDCFNFIYEGRVFELAGDMVKKLTSRLLMLVFTVFAAVVLVVSVVFLTAESLVSGVLLPAKAPKKKSLKENITGDKVPSKQSENCLRPWTSP